LSEEVQGWTITTTEWRESGGWVVERRHSWLNRFRGLLIRWEKKVVNYTAMLHMACAYIALRAAEDMG
jgi:transposase